MGAPPDRVYAFLLDVNRVVGCVPGAELSEVVDPNTFKGKVKIKVGPVTVAYAGTARISDRDETARTATLEGEGRETTGPGNARAKANMRVEESAGGSKVTVSTDFTVAGRVAQFGRGLMEDVSKSLVAQMAACIKSKLETAEQPPTVPASAPPADAGAETSNPPAPPPPSSQAPAQAQAAVQAAEPVHVLGLLWGVFVARIKALFGRRVDQPR
ncbi:MAG: SRPBCC family protein [Candidatus Dormibacteraeota bacterium]|nr:SRPBCC family protein [Candidatus Dormibacteraeota bacterium]